MKIIVASRNPVKLNATERGFAAMFPNQPVFVQGVRVPSGVADQPMTDAETRLGAQNRVHNAKNAQPHADLWVGIEGGVETLNDNLHAFAWVVVMGTHLTGEARTATFQLPPKIARLVHSGVELGHADDMVFQRENSKHKDGAIGILTQGLIDRTAYYEHAVMLALIPFKKSGLYSEE